MAKIGHFEVLEMIGCGAMGSVYRAVDPVIGRLVAIKVVRLIGYNDGDEAAFLKERLFKEARAAGGLSHPNIVTVYQLGTQDEQAYIVMEYIDGSTLDDRLASGTPADPLLIRRVLVEVAAALDYAHQCGIVHRDIKPANIMLTGPASGPPGSVKITDFGIAKTLLGHTSTKTGLILGTPYYMSPEQVSGAPLDGRSDQFALAVIAYQMLTGRRPFQGERVTSICYQIVHVPPPSLADIQPALPPAVSSVLNRALEKDPAKRFSTCSAFAAALIDACEQVMAPASDETALRRDPTIALQPLTTAPVVTRKLASRKILFGLTLASVLVTALVGIAGTIRLARRTNLEEKIAGGTAAPGAAVVPAVPRPRRMSQDGVSTASSGWIVWTGQARRGTLLRIENGRASIGRVFGELPGAPISVHVSPADRSRSRLTVFTADERYANPLRTSTSAGPALFLWDPRRVMDLTLWEAPNAANDWQRLVIRVNSAQLTACAIQWKRMPE